MNRCQLEEATKLSALLKETEQALQRARTANCFKLEMRQAGVGPDRFEDVGHCDGQSPKMSGSYGQLGTALQVSAIAYFEFHRELLTGQLRGLGIEI